MAKTVLITLTIAGDDTGPFSLYSNVSGFALAFETNISKEDLEAGYTSILVPDATSVIRVQSSNPVCDVYVDLTIVTTTSTSSTTTTSSSSTTTTTTSSVPTTTTTTTCAGLPPGPLPEPLTTQLAVPPGTAGIEVGWSPSESGCPADEYRLEWQEKETEGDPWPGSWTLYVVDNTFTVLVPHSSLTTGFYYRFRVRGENSWGNSAYLEGSEIVYE